MGLDLDIQPCSLSWQKFGCCVAAGAVIWILLDTFAAAKRLTLVTPGGNCRYMWGLWAASHYVLCLYRTDQKYCVDLQHQQGPSVQQWLGARWCCGHGLGYQQHNQVVQCVLSMTVIALGCDLEHTSGSYPAACVDHECSGCWQQSVPLVSTELGLYYIE